MVTKEFCEHELERWNYLLNLEEYKNYPSWKISCLYIIKMIDNRLEKFIK